MTTTQVLPEEQVIIRLKCPRCESVDIAVSVSVDIAVSADDSDLAVDYKCNNCGNLFNFPREDLRRMFTAGAAIQPIVLNRPIHELDLNLRIGDVGVSNQRFLKMLHSCIAILTCEDSSPSELYEAGLDMQAWFNSPVAQRCELATMMEAYIETKVGKVHWLRRACIEGECEICNERDKGD